MKPQKTVPAPRSISGRKPWVKKTPIEIFLDQIAKQGERVAVLREALAKEERELKKFEDARKVLEAK